MEMNGDRFPAAEAFIGDTKGQQVFIGVSGYDGGPYTSLPGNNERSMFYVNFDIKINSRGEFESVVSAGKTYSLGEWNKQVASTPLEYQKAQNSRSSVQTGGGCSGSENGCYLYKQAADEAAENPLIHQPGRPMQNGFIERFNGSYRKEILDAYVFFELDQVRALTMQWIEEYNTKRPHEGLGNATPREWLEKMKSPN